MRLSTFSIIARAPRQAEFGVASATAAPCVGAFLPFVGEAVGAIATQAWVNVNLGHHGIRLMRSGLSVGTVLEALLSEDECRDKRQVIGVDRDSTFGFTGAGCSDLKGHLLGKDFAIAGNMLANDRVLESMESAFKASKGDLGERLVAAVEAGQMAGGDSRGKMSAVLRIASPRPRLWHDLRVDLHPSPVDELRRLYDAAKVMQDELDAGGGGEVLHVQPVRY